MLITGWYPTIQRKLLIAFSEAFNVIFGSYLARGLGQTGKQWLKHQIYLSLLFT